MAWFRQITSIIMNHLNTDMIVNDSECQLKLPSTILLFEQGLRGSYGQSLLSPEFITHAIFYAVCIGALPWDDYGFLSKPKEWSFEKSMIILMLSVWVVSIKISGARVMVNSSRSWLKQWWLLITIIILVLLLLASFFYHSSPKST